MARPRSTRRSTMGWSCVVILTLLLMPAFVRARRSFTHHSTTPPYIRLNRGFDAPESRCDVPVPETVRPAAAAAEHTLPLVHEHAAPIRDIKPISQHDVPPDAFRGPPSSHATA